MRRFLALSLLAHLLFFFLPVAVGKRPLRRREAIKLHIAEKPLASRDAPKPATAGGTAPAARRAGKPRPAPAAPTMRTPEPPAPAGGIESLLPGGAYQYGFEGAAPPSARHAAIPTALRITSDEISGKLDIPLAFRKKNGVSKAVAKLVKTSQRSFVFDYLDGDPYMRAVLFEALRAKDGQEQVFRLFTALQTTEVVIVLKQTVVQGGGPTGETFEDFAVDGTKLTIAKTTVLGQTSGFMLPDADAKKAVRRDEAELERLKTSPAFISPLRHQGP